MRLLGVELTRFRCRRAVVVILLVAAGLAALLVATAAYDSRPVSAEEHAQAERRAAAQRATAEPEYRACRQDPASYFDASATEADCAQILPQPEWFLDRTPLNLAEELQGRGMTLLVLLAGTGVLIGATFAGADWSSGSMSNQLLFVPRRSKVWLAKAVGVVVGTTVLSAVIVALFWAALGGVAASRGLDAASATWRDIAQTSGRGLALVAAVALGSYAVTMLLRHTGATLGLLFAYAVVGEGLVASLPFDKMSQWSLPNNIGAWLSDGTEVFDDSLCTDQSGGCDPTYFLPFSHAAAYLGVLLAVAVVVSVLVFRRRDVS